MFLCVLKYFLYAVGILMEILTTSKTNTFLRSQDSQEMLMYCFYMFASFCECACILSNKIDRKLTMVSYAVASFVESYFAFHFIESRENSCMTMCWSLLAFVQGSAFLLQSMSVNNSSVLIIRNATMILHGTWFYHVSLETLFNCKIVAKRIQNNEKPLLYKLLQRPVKITV